MNDINLLEIKLNFIEDAKNNFFNIENKIIQFESKQSQYDEKFFRELYLIIHSVKGSSQAFQFDIISTICHVFEDNLTIIINTSIIDSKLFDQLYQLIDIFKEYAELFITKKESIDNHFFKTKYKNILYLKSKKENPIFVQESEVRILMIRMPNPIIKQLNHSLKQYQNIKVAFSDKVEESFSRIKIEKFDLIISSYIMTPINGVTLCMALKQQFKENTPFFVLNPTDHVNLEDIPAKYHPNLIIVRDQNTAVKVTELVQNIQDKKSNYVGKKKDKIMFIDDNQDILDLYKDVCDDKPNIEPIFDIGTTTLSQVIKEMPSLIICDVCIPNFNVLNFLIELKGDEKTKNIPIVFITGDSQQSICKDLIHHQATAIVEKNFINLNFFENLAKIKIHF